MALVASDVQKSLSFKVVQVLNVVIPALAMLCLAALAIVCVASPAQIPDAVILALLVILTTACSLTDDR